jgi:hypothetical protein
MKRSLVLTLALVLALGSVAAEGLAFDIKGVALNWAIVPGLPLPTGADLQFGLPVARIGEEPLAVVARLRGGYDDRRILRDPLSGDVVGEPGDFDGAYRFHSPNFQWALGATEGLLPREGGNLLEAFLFYRGRYDIDATSLSATAFLDMKGLSGTSFLGGLAYDSTAMDSRRVYTGLFAELSAEDGPAGLNASSGTDFWRVTLKAKGFLPLSMGQAGDEKLSLFSLYLAGFASADYAGGDHVPIWVMQTFGGRDLRDSLGDCVRGYPSRSYDSTLKLVANGEVRAIGPALFGQAWLVPMGYAFLDAGYYSGFANDTGVNAAAKGSILSAGLGFNINVVDFVNLGLYAGLKFPGGSPLYATYTTKDAFFWDFQFLLHF